MSKKTNVRVIALPKMQYDKEWLDTLSDKELSETACAEGDSQIWSSLQEFQDTLHGKDVENNLLNKYWIYFLND